MYNVWVHGTANGLILMAGGFIIIHCKETGELEVCLELAVFSWASFQWQFKTEKPFFFLEYQDLVLARINSKHVFQNK